MRKSLVIVLFGMLLSSYLLALDFNAKTFTDQTGLKPMSNKDMITVAEGQKFQVAIVNLERLAALGVPIKNMKAGAKTTVTYKGNDHWLLFWASKDVPFDWK
jgi:hypothetical protein